MRRSYRARGTSDRAREYSKGRRDSNSLSFYDNQIDEYKKRIKALETKKKTLKVKISKVWDQYNALLTEGGIIDDAIEKLQMKITNNKNRQSDRFDKQSNMYFQHGYKTLVHNADEEFNNGNTSYMSPYSRGHISKFLVDEGRKVRRNRR